MLKVLLSELLKKWLLAHLKISWHTLNIGGDVAWLFLSFSFRPKEVTRVGRCGSVSYSVSHLKPLGTIWAEFPTVVEIIMIPGLSECIIITIAHHLSFCRRWCYNWEISCIKSKKIYNHWMIIIIMGIKLIFGYLIVRLNYYCCF